MTPSATIPPRVKPGRPPEADARHIARIALQLFEQNGFEAVTMEQVAKAASVSRRTLFRYFPSKADLVWADTGEVLATLRSLAAPLEGRKLRLHAIVSELFIPVLESLDEPTLAELARRRLKLISATPTLLNHPMLQEVNALLASLLSTDALPRSASAPLVARTLSAATFTALQWWAEHGEGQRALDTTLGALQAIATVMER